MIHTEEANMKMAEKVFQIAAPLAVLAWVLSKKRAFAAITAFLYAVLAVFSVRDILSRIGE